MSQQHTSKSTPVSHPHSSTVSGSAPRGSVAIVGLGGCFPDAENIDTYWQNICAGHVAIGQVPTDRWDPALWYSSDRTEPEKTYSQIGGFLKKVPFERKRFRIPPRTLESVDDAQKLALTAVAEALADAGLEVFPDDGSGKPFDRARVAVMLGNAMGGEAEDLTSLRVWFPRARVALEQSEAFRALSIGERQRVLDEFEDSYKAALPRVTEDSMPGELSNCITGRIANCFDLHGPNFTTDAACAASMAALQTAVNGLRLGNFDLALAGGVDRQMDPPTFVKFAKIGALSGEHSAPFDGRANGFVMGEGAGILVLKRLEDAERDGDRIYAVVRAVGAASDGRGKGMTAPNPRGQALAIERAYQEAEIPITDVGLFEAHGTSTTVGDATELAVLTDMLHAAGASPVGVPIGSVKSMIGHLKSAAGAAALIKAALAIYHGKVPPSANFQSPSTDSPLHKGFLRVPVKPTEWQGESDRVAGVSAFGFGGTNFHAVLAQYVEGRPRAQRAGERQSQLTGNDAAQAPQVAAAVASAAPAAPRADAPVAALSAQAIDRDTLMEEIKQLFAEQTGYDVSDLDSAYELEADLGIDTVKQAEVLSLLRQRYSLPQEQDSFKLSDVSTLDAVVDYVADRTAREGVGKALDGSNSVIPANAGIQEKPSKSALLDPRVREDDVDPNSTTPSHAIEATKAVEAKAAPSVPRVLLFAGSSKEQVLAQATAQLEGLRSLSEVHRANADDAGNAATRLAFVAQDLADARAKLEDAGKQRARRLVAQGIFWSEGRAAAAGAKLAFLFPGQGSQYVGMLRDLAAEYAVVARTFEEADRVLKPVLGESLTDIVWASGDELAEREAADLALRRTEICQPAMLAADVALMRLLRGFGIEPDVVAGHSLGEYAACVASGVMSFADALFAVSARGREMAEVDVADNGRMASVAAGADKVEPVLKEVDGYVIAANKNCHSQTVIAGDSQGIERALERFKSDGVEAREIPVSHAFHSAIVAPVAEPLRRVLTSLDIRKPNVPILSNVDATYYPDDKQSIVDSLARQLASPVEFIAQIDRMYEDGVRVFIEVGPRRAVTGFVRNILGDRPHTAVATNHHKKAGADALYEALAALASEAVAIDFDGDSDTHNAASENVTARDAAPSGSESLTASSDSAIVVSGTSIFLPGEATIPAVQGDPYAGLVEGRNAIQPIDDKNRRAMVSKSVVRLNKVAGEFEAITELGDVIQLAARLGDMDLESEYGLDGAFVDALDSTSRLAVAAGIDALRDAGIPLVRHYRKTSTGKQLHDRWALPTSIGRRTGVVFASAFPGLDRIIDEVSRHLSAKHAGRTADELEAVLEQLTAASTVVSSQDETLSALRARVCALRDEASLYEFNRKFLFRVLSMGHAQLAQTVLAQGPNTQVNAACASGTVAIGVAHDWLNTGRCDRVIVVSADNVTHDAVLPWVGAGFLASGAASTDSDVQRAAVPFGRHRNGMILGAGAAGFVLERSADVVARGMKPVAELALTKFSNSGFHGTRLDGAFISEALRDVVEEIQQITGLSSSAIAAKMMFVSHETYTPARGGSSAAEIEGLRHAFGGDVSSVLIANTKGYTGHPMGATFEDIIAVKGLQRGAVPAVANLNNLDPEFEGLRFADGSPIDAEFALRFSAGFGSQIAVTVYRKLATQEARLQSREVYHAWLDAVTQSSETRLELSGRVLRVADQGGAFVDTLEIPSLALESSFTLESAAPSQSVGIDAILGEVAAIFAEHTGYELDDLDPDYDLEADLGIDTVKQAEILSLLRERYGIGADDNFTLSSVQTLRAVAQYVHGSSVAGDPCAPADTATLPIEKPQAERVLADAEKPVTEVLPVAANADGHGGAENLLADITQLFAEHTGYDVEDFSPDHELEADLGIDTVKQAEIFTELRARYSLRSDESFKLSDVQTLNAVVAYVDSMRAEPVPSPADATAQPLTFEHFQPTAVEASPDEKEAMRPFGLTRVRPVVAAPANPWVSYRGRRVAVSAPTDEVADRFAGNLRARGAEVDLVSDGDTFSDFTNGPPEDLVYVLDDAAQVPNIGTAHARIERLFAAARSFARSHIARATQEGAVTPDLSNIRLLVVGWSSGVFTEPALGAAAGMVKSLAKEWQGARCLAVDHDIDAGIEKVVQESLDELASTGPAEIAWNAGERWTLGREEVAMPSIVEQEAVHGKVIVATGGARGITYEILRRLAEAQPKAIVILARTEPMSPTDSKVWGRTAEQQKITAREALVRLGAKTNPVAIRRWIESELAQVHVFHNLECLRRAAGGTDTEVLWVACDVSDAASIEGAATLSEASRNGAVDILIHGAGREESRRLVDKDAQAFNRMFAPKAGALNALCAAFSPKRVVTFGSIAGRFGNDGQADYAAANESMAAWCRNGEQDRVNIAWTAWADVGMATQGSTAAVLEAAGLEMLPASAGSFIGAAIISSAIRGDVVVAGALGALADGEQAVLPPTVVPSVKSGLFDSVRAEGDVTLFGRRMDPVRDPGLGDHRIESVATLPGVVGLDMMVQAATSFLGTPVALVQNVQFELPLRFFRDKPLEVVVEVRAGRDGEPVGCYAVLCSIFTAPSGRTRRREHFSLFVPDSASVVQPLVELPALELPRQLHLSREQVYRRYFHGPSFRVLGTLGRLGENGIEATPVGRSPEWLDGVHTASMATRPLVREAAFQAAGLWEMMELGRMALPSSIDEVRLNPVESGDGALSIEVRRRRRAGSGALRDGAIFDIQIMDDSGRVVDVMTGYRTVTFRDLSPDERFEPEEGRSASVCEIAVSLEEVRGLLERDRDATIERYLSRRERRHWQALKTAKRQVEWLAGRIAAKRLVREQQYAEEGAVVPYAAIVVLAEESGAPRVSVTGADGAAPQVSIAHAAGVALAFRSERASVRPGIDVESVASRSPGFVRDYFTDAEQAEIAAAPEPDKASTAIWAVKEAYLKALGIGARVDFRDVEVRASDWRVTPTGGALKRAQLINAQSADVRVRFEEHDPHAGSLSTWRVVAHVLLTVEESTHGE